MQPKATGGSELARHWPLDPDVDFLNHGSFGACPTAVLEVQAELRARLERQPARFFLREWEPLLDGARARLAEFLGAAPDDLVVVRGATEGVNAVLASLDLAQGDAILITDNGYGACRNAAVAAAGRRGAVVTVAHLPFPVAAEEELVAAILDAVTPRTRLALLDHVTSPTALVLPLERLVRELENRGVDVLVDGAHAPGQVDVHLDRLGAAYYTGNCHKWISAPKASGFLHVRADRRRLVQPVVVSHGLSSRRPGRSRFHDGFDWPGTQDPTPFLAVPAALDAMASFLPGGWPAIRERNLGLALAARDRLCAGLCLAPPAPDSMLAAMASVPLPDGDPGPSPWALATGPLQDALLVEHGIEVPVMPWPSAPRRLLRISAQLYNREEQFARLAEVLPALLARSRA